MKRIIDIKGYDNASLDWNLPDKDMWEGQLLLEEDGWFEGIVKDLNDDKEKIIFGIYHPEKVIELYKYPPRYVGSSFKYHGDRNAKGYDGKFFICSSLTETLYGNCHIITQYKELNRGNIDTEVTNLEIKIQKWKDKFMHYTDCGAVYNDLISTRKGLSEIILRIHNGESFTQEEIAMIKNGINPVQDITVKTTTEKIKKI